MLRCGNTATLGRLTTPHWEGYTTPSPDFSFLERNQIVFNYVPTGVKVGIKGVTALLAVKVRLIGSIRSGNVSTFTAFLRSVSCVYIGYSYSFSLCFILYKLLELCEVPTMHPASILFIGFNPFSDSFEFLKHNYSTNRNKFNYFFGNFMVNISPKPFLLLRELLKMSFCRKSAFGLKSPAECEVPFGNSSYMSTIKELIGFPIWSGNYCKLMESKINSYVKVGRLHIRDFFFNGDVKKKPFEFLVVPEVSRGNFPIQILFKVIRNFYLKLLSTVNCSKGSFFSIQPNSIGTLVITDGWVTALRTLALKTFPFPFNCRFKAFSGYNPCGNNELRWKGGFLSNCVVSKFVEFNTVPKISFSTNLTSIIVGKLILFNGFKKCLLLFFGRVKDKFNSALQFYIHILYQYLQKFKRGFLPSLMEGVSNRREGDEITNTY